MKHDKRALFFSGRKTKWFRPINLVQFLQLKNEYPDAKVVSGNTEVGIETTLKNMQYNVRIHVGDLEELKGHKFNGKKSGCEKILNVYTLMLTIMVKLSI